VAPPPGRPRTRVVAWNIRAGGGYRVDAILHRLGRWAPDVVALSEFRATPPSAALAAGLAARGLVHQVTTASPREPGANALLLAARWPLARREISGAPVEPARWLFARMAAPRPIALGVMHVPNRVSGRKYPFLDAVLALARARWGEPALLVGDTNSGRIGADEQVPAFNAREDGWMLDLAAAGWTDAFRHRRGAVPGYTWYSPNGRNGFRIDQAFVNPALLPAVVETRHAWGGHAGGPRRAPSDHAAIILDLDLAGQRAGSRPRAPRE
jgi:exonuclease III